MGLFTKGQTLALKRKKFILSPDAYVFIRELSSQEQPELQHKHEDKSVPEMDFNYELLAMCLCDDDGKPLFMSADEVKKDLLIGFSALIDLVQAILDLSGIKAKN